MVRHETDTVAIRIDLIGPAGWKSHPSSGRVRLRCAKAGRNLDTGVCRVVVSICSCETLSSCTVDACFDKEIALPKVMYVCVPHDRLAEVVS